MPTVIKRSGAKVEFNIANVAERLSTLVDRYGLHVDIDKLLEEVSELPLADGSATNDVDTLITMVALGNSFDHPDYALLSGMIEMTALRKRTDNTFSAYVERAGAYVNPRNRKPSPALDGWFLKYVMEHRDALDAAIVQDRDLQFNLFAMKTLKRSYLIRLGSVIVERPQYMYMRIAIELGRRIGIDRVLMLYEHMSKGLYTHASPTMFNAGTPMNQLSSCFKIRMKSDSIEGIYDTLKMCAMISKTGGGIGLAVSDIRAAGSYIAGTGGTSNGLVPMLRNYNSTARYVDQGGNKRPGAFAAFIEPWHADIFDVVSMRVPLDSEATHASGGSHETKGLDLNYGIWTCDEFMRRVEADEDWTLMCPDECPGLVTAYGDEFTRLYRQYEAEGRGKRTIKAWDLYEHIVKTQIETGEPYMLYKDAVNEKSNQKNIGPIVCSNLCVTGDTKLLTSVGHIDICKLDGQRTTIWNGEEWVDDVPVRRTSAEGDDRPVITVVTSHGLSIECTPEHEFVLVDGKTKIPAKELRIGVELFQPKEVIYEGLPLADEKGRTADAPTKEEMHEAWYSGFIAGRLIEVGGRQRLTLNLRETLKCPWIRVEKSEKELCTKLGWDPAAEVPGADRLNPEDLELFAYIPVPNEKQRAVYPLTAHKYLRVAWCSGFKDAIKHLDFAASIYQTLMPTLLMFRSVGFRVKLAPEDTSGSGVWCIREINDNEPLTVAQIIDNGRKAATYCVTEPKEHRAVFNGTCTGQCTEMMMHSSPDEISVCTLASIALPKYVDEKTRTVNYQKIADMAGEITVNLNEVIDVQTYVSHEMENSNYTHRPIGIGVQGLADMFAKLKLPFTSAGAKEVNKRVFDAIYYGFLHASCKMAQDRGAPYKTFAGSPLSEGKFQFDLWGVGPLKGSPFDWEGLRARIVEHGVMNSLGIAVMPTASTAQILGNHEQCTPFLGNVYQRKVLGGVFTVVNEHLVKDLTERGLWSDAVKEELITNRGSVQNIKEVPSDLKEIYKTVWELDGRDLVDMQVDRGPMVDHSQSFVVYIAEPNIVKVSSLHMYTWKKGLKTGMYYLRTRAASQALQFTVVPKGGDKAIQKALQESKDADAQFCTLTNREECLSCGS